MKNIVACSSLFVPGLASTLWPFYPDNASTPVNPYMPVDFGVYTSQNETVAVGNSYWACSFVTASNGHQYMALTHTEFEETIGIARSSILDITNTSYYNMELYAVEDTSLAVDSDGRFDATVGHVGVRSLSDDNLSLLNLYNSGDEITFDLNFTGSSQVVFNGGSGYWKFTPSWDLTGEWALPAGRTSGTITVEGETLTVDPDLSFT